ncbi:HAMP domain-containing sensor histidine kinase [Carboxydochorda subterranea]|uniref:histidine kinase n=1 Tax=Carboxydichorda subterranea TaxID=3109565 RepID=A0ABZ1BY69_9FIRM|nr:HAMP domain-containing sensor histidine kinase [Limnochorda sp. L945t]WRP17756.1 HAMP domain-containing sensor histidine kinase [Limnochorda sp. L945t]
MSPAGWWRDHFPVRLAVTTAAVLTLVMLLAMGAFYVAAASVLWRQVDTRLASRLGLPAASPEHEDERESHLAERLARRYDEHEEYRYVLRRGPDGPELGSLGWLWPGSDDVLVALDAPGSSRIVGQVSLHEMAEALSALRGVLAVIGLVGTVVVSGVAFLSARRAFSPVERMIQAAAQLASAPQIDSQALGVRVPPADGDATLRELATTFNTMMARLRRAFEAQQRLVDDASHELRTPLGALVADLEVALRSAQTPEAYRDALERALVQARRLTDLANQLLALARYDQGAGVSIRPDCPIAPVADQAVQDVRHLAERAGVTLVTDVEEGLQAPCDPIAVARLLTNLLKNAIEASPPDSLVTLVARRQGPELVLEIADRGRGMAPEEIERAFEPFYRRLSPSGEGGTGLGLTISRAIAAAHGGTIELDSRPGHGTTARVRLPLRAADGSARTPAPRAGG